MNKLSTLFAAAIISLNLFSQTAPVPTNWDCNGTPPEGWVQVQTGTATNLNYVSADLYTSAPASARLDNTGEFIRIDINDEPGFFTYNIKGSTGGGGSWSGTFNSQYSINGTAWVDMRTFTTLPTGSSPFLSIVDTPSSQARFLRLFFTNKVSGSNVAIDDVAVNVPVPGPNQEIQLYFNDGKITTGSNIWFSGTVSATQMVKLKVKNLGLDSALTLSNPVLSGTAAADYSIANFPASILAQDSADIEIDFTPSASGTLPATLTFNNNDADENPYTVLLNGVGGNFATEPTANPNSINFSSIKSYSMRVGVKGNSSDGYLVLRKAGSAVTDAPIDGQTYDVGMGVGASKVFYVGKDTSFTVRESEAGIEYHYSVFPFNGVGQYTKYKTTSPLTASQVSGAALPGSYYNSIDTASTSFVTQLSTLINNHTQVFYSNYKSTIIDNFYTRDTTGDQKVVNCEYSGQFVLFTPPFDFTAQNMSREHCFASSWMPTFGKTAHTDRFAYSDLHNLRLANQNDVNQPRSNFPFDEVVNQTATFLGAKFGTDTNSKKVFEPLDAIKGDVARSIMYMLVAYNRQLNRVSASSNAQAVTDWWTLDTLSIPGLFPNPDEKLSTRQKQALLKKWNQQDPPSPFERARNEFVFDQQANRNPFSDFPEWACYIDFNTMTYIPNGCNATVGIEELKGGIDVLVYPNPSFERVTVSLISGKSFSGKMEITDMTGRTVYSRHAEVQTGENWFEIGVSILPAGNYLFTLSGNGVYRKQLQVGR